MPCCIQLLYGASRGGPWWLFRYAGAFSTIPHCQHLPVLRTGGAGGFLFAGTPAALGAQLGGKKSPPRSAATSLKVFFLSLPCRSQLVPGSKAPRCCAQHHLPTARGCLVLPSAKELPQAGRAATSLPWIITAERQSRHISARQLHSWVRSLQPLCSLITSKRSRLSPQHSAVCACGSSPNLS